MSLPIVSSDSSGSDDDEIVEQIKRERVAGIGDETPELFCTDQSEMCEEIIMLRFYKRLIGCY